MLAATLVFVGAVVLFFLGYAVAIRVARRRWTVHALRAAQAEEELERRLIRLGTGLGVGA